MSGCKGTDRRAIQAGVQAGYIILLLRISELSLHFASNQAAALNRIYPVLI